MASHQLRVRVPDENIEVRLRDAGGTFHRDYGNLVYHILIAWLEHYERTGLDIFAHRSRKED